MQKKTNIFNMASLNIETLKTIRLLLEFTASAVEHIIDIIKCEEEHR